MAIEINNRLINDVSEKIREMNVDKKKDIIELIDLLHNNETIKYEGSEYPIVRITEALGIYPFTASDMNEKGYLYVDGTTSDIYGCNQVIAVDKSLPLKKQREVIANLLGVYLLDYLPNFNEDHRKTYAATYGKTNMNNKANFFEGELLTPSSLLLKQYNKVINQFNDPYALFATRRYLEKYFNVSYDLIDKRIDEIAYENYEYLEKTNPKNKNGKKNNIVLNNYKK